MVLSCLRGLMPPLQEHPLLLPLRTKKSIRSKDPNTRSGVPDGDQGLNMTAQGLQKGGACIHLGESCQNGFNWGRCILRSNRVKVRVGPSLSPPSLPTPNTLSLLRANSWMTWLWPWAGFCITPSWKNGAFWKAQRRWKVWILYHEEFWKGWPEEPVATSIWLSLPDVHSSVSTPCNSPLTFTLEHLFFALHVR